MSDSTYTIEVDTWDRSGWLELMSSFDDANLYQLWNEPPERNLVDGVSRLLVRADGAPAAAAEVRLLTLPWMKHGIAYTLWGPMWRARSQPANPERFRQAVRAMFEEYVVKRRLVLRLKPRLFVGRDQPCLDVLCQEGFSAVPAERQKQSLIIDLSAGLEELRKGFDKKWRNCLSKAERSELAIEAGTSLELFDEFVTVYDSMLMRKGFTPTASITKHRRIQSTLPDHLKMSVVVARQSGVACAGAIYSTLGDTAVFLFGATNDSGMQHNASYLVQWTVLQRLTASSTKSYDLNGIDPVANPGPYHFKKGLAGRNAIEVSFAGQYEAYEGTLANRTILWLEKQRAGWRGGQRSSAINSAAAPLDRAV